jgi:hypothetical protein
MAVPYNRITRQTAVNMTVTVPLRPADVEWTVYRRYGQHPYANSTLYGRNRIRVRWPALDRVIDAIITNDGDVFLFGANTVIHK